MKYTLSIFSALLYFFSLYINFLAGSGQLNNIGTGEISALYPTLFTPAGITFSIWGLIFLFNTVFVLTQVYLAFKNPLALNAKLNVVYIVLSLANISWLFLWHHLHVSIALIVIVLYLLCTLRAFTITQKLREDKTFIHRFAYFNFSIYAGWLSVATIANTAVCLTTIGVPWEGTLAVALTILVLIVALSLGYFFLFGQNNYWYPLVLVWAFFGIYLASAQRLNEDSAIIKWAALVCLLLLLLLAAYRLLGMRAVRK